MKKPFWKIVNEVIKESDVVLEVLDARLISETRNKEIEEKIKNQNKKLIHVVNKIDLVDKNDINLKDLTNPVFISSKERLGTTILKNKIMEIGKKDKIIVGVLGYPNTGKSSVINAIAGRKSARTSPSSGFTKGIQKIRAGERIFLLDTPGVLPFEEKDEVKHTLIGSKNVQDIKEPDLIAVELMKILKGRIEKHYGVEVSSDYEKTLEKIAEKMHKFKKGGVLDTDNTARMIIIDWQRGKIR